MGKQGMADDNTTVYEKKREAGIGIELRSAKEEIIARALPIDGARSLKRQVTMRQNLKIRSRQRYYLDADSIHHFSWLYNDIAGVYEQAIASIHLTGQQAKGF